jgi:ribosomal protein S18 acetylase RimI-like enzyme
MVKSRPRDAHRLVEIVVERLESMQQNDIGDMCDAAEATMQDSFGFNIGFSRFRPTREQLEAYFNGVIMVPERVLIVGRVDGVICGSIQLVKPLPSQETTSFVASVDNHFVAPWARGHGLARKLVEAAESEARHQGFSVLRLSVCAHREAAIKLYESCDYIRWGTLDKYELMAGEIVAGHFYYKDL